MTKTALCIGNGAYPDSPLKNPTNDARNLADRLTSLGFATVTMLDASTADMDRALTQFGTALNSAEVGLVFFAGHGMQIAGENYLTAVNTKFDSEIDAKYSSLPLNKVIEVLEHGPNSTSIIVLDACRNNPYERRWRNVGSMGLAPVYAPRGTFIAFATSPGQVALDGVGENGAFTAALLRHITSQNVTIEDLFKRVRNTLSASTSGRQTSWEHTSLMGDFFFNTAILTGEYVTEYSESALADSKFRIVSGRPLSKIISDLGSCNWYTQNPAIDGITAALLSNAGKDELFVLGRNIYQTACGGSTSADSLMSSLDSWLATFNREVAFHVLNGMLYEIYFDRIGRYRITKKTDKLDAVFALEENSHFAPSFDFISQALLPYQKDLFYVPGRNRNLVLDISVGETVDNKGLVRGVILDGQDILYDNDGVTLVANAAPYDDLRTNSMSEFQEELRTDMVVPRSRFVVTYCPQLAAGTKLLLPYGYRILTYSRKRDAVNGSTTSTDPLQPNSGLQLASA